MGFGFIAVLLCGNMKRFDTVTSFRWTYEQKYRRNNRDISPQTIPSVSFLPRRDSTCPLTLLTDTDNYFFFIRGSLHVPSCLFVGFFLLFCGFWVLWWYGIFKRSTHEYEILFFFHSWTLNHDNYTSRYCLTWFINHDCRTSPHICSTNSKWSSEQSFRQTKKSTCSSFNHDW